MYTDPIADYLTRVRNAVAAKHKVVEIPASNLKKEILQTSPKYFILGCFKNSANLEPSGKIWVGI